MMKTLLKTLVIAGAFASLVLTGCDKSDDPLNQNPGNNSSSAPAISISDGYGVLAAVRSVSYTNVGGMNIPLEVNTAVAAFSATKGSNSYVDAGTVTLNTKGLTKSSGNAYVYQNLTDVLSLSSVNWNVSGSGSVPAISYSDDRPLPDYSGFNSLPSVVTRSAGLTIQLGSAVSNADSVYIVVSDYNNHTLIKRVGGKAPECTISAADLASFTAGQGLLQVVPWSYKEEDFGDKPYYFVLESAYTKSGITIN